MINLFPNFKEIQASDIYDMYAFTNKFDPYSDFNFTSLYSYNTDGLNKISMLNDNLVIILQDYHTSKPFISLLGNSQSEETIEILIDYSVKNLFGNSLKMVPESSLVTVLNTDQNKFEIIEDRDNFDYIYEIQSLASLDGHEHHVNRRQYVKFIENYPSCSCKILDLTNSSIIDSIFKLFELWTYQNDKNAEDTNVEREAINRFIKLSSSINCFAFGIYDEDILIDFSFYEKISSEFALGHFGKANKNYSGLYRFAQTMACKELSTKGIKYLNLEQDLGIEGLRQTKLLWRPIKYLKKYIIKKADTI